MKRVHCGCGEWQLMARVNKHNWWALYRAVKIKTWPDGSEPGLHVKMTAHAMDVRWSMRT